ncbi:nucleotidase [Candidatus Pelagibacter bacterium]|nr:nucleotidase [Candidatus Pelagibacter bacterium]MDB2709246.1 nucleotidase [Candidatus Pelagibacter bacterium]
MIIGIDLDNTIINYENSFIRQALKKKLITKNLKINNKDQLKKKIRDKSKTEWTKLQGEIYGKYINDAKIEKKFLELLKILKENNCDVFIISHKTKHPILGKKINLRQKSLKFINKNITFDLIPKKSIYFEDTIEKKIQRIHKCSCDYFIDDLAKIFKHTNFPKYVKKILYNPKSHNSKSLNWTQICSFFKNELKKNKKIIGKNNKSFILNEEKVFVKQFYNYKNDYDRYERELKFLNFLSKKNINSVPKVLDFNNTKKKIKYSLISGNIIRKKDSNNIKFIKQSFQFIKKINELNYHSKNFKYAKGFCKSSKCFEKEINLRLKVLKNNKFIKSIIDDIKKKFQTLKENNYFNNKYHFNKNDKILSPCDFNYNNIIFSNKKATFVDFEYSGIDDPAKLYAIFFLQPDYHIKIKTFNDNIDKLIFIKINKFRFKNNLIYLLPICYLRWALILLNDFSDLNSKRRNFSNNEHLKSKQLYKQKIKVIYYLNSRLKYFNLYKNYLS